MRLFRYFLKKDFKWSTFLCSNNNNGENVLESSDSSTKKLSISNSSGSATNTNTVTNSSDNKSSLLMNSDDETSINDITGQNCLDILLPIQCLKCWLTHCSHRSNIINQNERRTKANRKRIIKLLLIGLDNAGKTTLALNLAGESVDDVVATIGFSKYEIIHKSSNNNSTNGTESFKIILYDVGGGSRIRAIWKNYYSLVHGIIFVIDSADLERILEVKELIEEIVSNPSVAGKPILLFLNKKDIHDSMDEIDVCKFTNVEELTAKNGCLTKIIPISAKIINQTITEQNGNNNNIDNNQRINSKDPAIETGLQWLLDIIVEQWPELNTRVEEESQQQINKENDKMQQRIKKIQQRNFIEIESKVPKPESLSSSLEQPNELNADQLNSKQTIIEQEKQMNQELETQFKETSEAETSITKSSEIEDQVGSSTSTIQSTRRPTPLKRTNKIHPTIDKTDDEQ